MPQSSWKRNFALLWLSQLLAMLGFSCAIPFMPLYVQQLEGLSTTEAAAWAGALSSVAAITMAVMAPVWGTVADRYGRKPMVTRSMIGGGAVVGLMALAADVRQLFALRALQGTFSGTVAASRVLVASIVPSDRLGQSLGLMATAAFVGNSVGPLVGGLIADRLGYAAAFVVTGTLLVVSGVLVMLFVHEQFQRPTLVRPRSLRQNLAILYEMPRIRAVVVAMFAVQVGQMAASPVLPLFVAELVGSGEGTAGTVGIILGAAAATSAVAASIGGRLGDRIGHRRVLAIAAIAAGVLYLPQALAQAPWQLVAVRALIGIFAGAIMPVGMAIVGLLSPPDSRGWIFGLTATATALGNAAGPLIGAGFATAFGLRASFAFTAVALTAAGIWIAFMLRDPRADERPA